MQTQQTPLISVVVRSYNDGPFLAQAIKSVQQQTYQNLEIIIINDASEDSTYEIAEQLRTKDLRIRTVHNPKNLGVSKVGNIGLKLARGKYVANLDGDDFWLESTKLKQQVGFLEANPEHVLVGCFVQNVGKEGQLLDRCAYATNAQAIRRKILRQNQLANSTVMLRRVAALQAGGYPNELKTTDDLGLWLKMGQLGHLGNLPYYWSAHRMKGNNIGEYRRREQIQEALWLAKKHKHDYPNYYLARLRLGLESIAYGLPRPLIKLIRIVKQVTA